jgi:hypothetical protein
MSSTPDPWGVLIELEAKLKETLLGNNRAEAWLDTKTLDYSLKTLYLENTKREITLKTHNKNGKLAYSGVSRTYICGCGSEICKLCLHFTRKDTSSAWKWRRRDRELDEMQTELLHSKTCMAKGKIKNLAVAENMLLTQEVNPTDVKRIKRNEVSPILRRNGLDFALKGII